jgi:crotonobetainyl-CoA:carnitine CoA-transferase CaiB-like acyl-CoA transferase
MADFGAEVIKIEYVRRLCVMRGARLEDQMYNRHPRWHQNNRNKYAITLDFDDKSHCKAFKDLVKISDVVLNNFRGGVLERLDFSYEKLIKIKPDLIVVSMPAFGDTGPYRKYAGVGAAIEALSGIQSLTAYEKTGKKMRIREMDLVAGTAGASAILTALIHRQRTGQGQYIDLSQMEAATHALIGEHLLERTMNGMQTLPLGNRHKLYAPQGCYRCKGDDKWVAIVIRSEEEWERFCGVLEHPEWKTDERFNSQDARRQHHDILDRSIEEWTTQFSHREVMEILQQASISAGAVLDVAEIGADPHLKERGFFLNAEGDNSSLYPGVPFKLSEGNVKIRWRGPNLGEHNQYIFCERLGRSKDEVPSVNEDEIGTGYDPE